MPFPISCVIIEDEPAWRRKLHEQLSQFSELKVVGEAESLDEAFTLIETHHPQAAFMDIKLVGGTAFQLMDRLENRKIPIPTTVMITGFPEYALEVLNKYRKHVVKFLPKPMLENWREKLRDAIDTVTVDLMQKEAKDYFVIRTPESIVKVPFAETAWLEVAPKGKIYLVSDKDEFLVNQTLASFLEAYPHAPMQQISRNFAINTCRIQRVLTVTREVAIEYRGEEKIIGIGDSFYSALMNSF